MSVLRLPVRSALRSGAWCNPEQPGARCRDAEPVLPREFVPREVALAQATRIGRDGGGRVPERRRRLLGRADR